MAGGAVLGGSVGAPGRLCGGEGRLPQRHGESWGSDQDAFFYSLFCTGRMQKVESKWIQRLSAFI